MTTSHRGDCLKAYLDHFLTVILLSVSLFDTFRIVKQSLNGESIHVGSYEQHTCQLKIVGLQCAKNLLHLTFT